MARASGTTIVPHQHQNFDDAAESNLNSLKETYRDKREFLFSLSELRESIHCDRKLAERGSFLKRAGDQVSQCKSILQEKWIELRDGVKSIKNCMLYTFVCYF